MLVHLTYQLCFKMEDYVKSELQIKKLKKVGSDSGCINNAGIYETEKGKIFIKYNSKSEAKVMFEGEFESLKELSHTLTAKVPNPLLVGNIGKKFFIAMEYVDMRSLSKYSSRLGSLLAEMHMHNIRRLRRREKSESVHCRNDAIDKFGFHLPTACGCLPQPNEWADDWANFFMEQKLQQQINWILARDGNREICELWSQLQLKIPSFFQEIKIEPSLLHGDLWFGNAGETSVEPIIFDPASFYGHHEYDLAIAAMFHGFGNDFFDSYHSLIPKANGFKERHQLYLLFHHLNHWNHFGSHKKSSLQIMRNLLK